jgi:(R)-2-hydroxyacyl-CoA dehydratese activating ATPase
MISAGIDIGSITAKAALVDDGTLVATRIIFTGYNPAAAAREVFAALLSQTGIPEASVRRIVATGYGRASVDFAHKTLTEIICHGAGAHFLDPDVRGVIDVGGQDSKAILLDANGQVENFAMNDKCAAGTGRFLEVMAQALQIPLDQMGEISLGAETPVKISSICTVFAESEVISMIARQKNRRDIAAGIHISTAARVASLAGKIHLGPPVVMTGGVAKNKGMVKALEDRLGYTITVGAMPQENGAVGAAFLAAGI